MIATWSSGPLLVTTPYRLSLLVQEMTFAWRSYRHLRWIPLQLVIAIAPSTFSTMTMATRKETLLRKINLRHWLWVANFFLHLLELGQHKSRFRWHHWLGFLLFGSREKITWWNDAPTWHWRAKRWTNRPAGEPVRTAEQTLGNDLSCSCSFCLQYEEWREAAEMWCAIWRHW